MDKHVGTNCFSSKQARVVSNIISSQAKREQVELLSAGTQCEWELDHFLEMGGRGAVFINVRERGHVSGLRSAIKMFL